MLGNQPRLVALQRADEMPFQIESGRRQCFVDSFLNVVFAECPLSASAAARTHSSGQVLLTASNAIS